MSRSDLNPVLQLIRRVLDDPRVRDSSDQELLCKFVADRDERAFEAILRRHGPMVFDVCRGMLLDPAEAEDAFQATFLVLTTKANSIRKAVSLASWLHGVAYRMACKAQTEFARRRKHEGFTAAPIRTLATDEISWREIRQVVHEELERLPRRCRDALALCYLQGMTQDQAAAALHLPKGTLKGRLERGRAILRARLVRRGLGATALLVTTAWPAAGELSATLIATTLQSSIGLAAGQRLALLVPQRIADLVQGFLKAIVWKKIKLAGALIALFGAVCLGSYVVAGRLSADSAPTLDRLEDNLWAISDDGLIALRVSAVPARAKVSEPITLIASLRNISGRPMRVLRPFGRGADSINMTGLEIHGNSAKLRYDGPHDADVAFTLLAPGQTVEDSIVIRAASAGFKLRGMNLPAVQQTTFEYVYGANANADPVALVDIWKGRIRSKTISAEIEGERR